MEQLESQEVKTRHDKNLGSNINTKSGEGGYKITRVIRVKKRRKEEPKPGVYLENI